MGELIFSLSYGGSLIVMGWITKVFLVKMKKKGGRCKSIVNCSKPFNIPIICQRCYRIKYCSNECEEEFRSYHYDECLNSIP